MKGTISRDKIIATESFHNAQVSIANKSEILWNFLHIV